MLPAITCHPTSCQNALQLPLVSDRAVFSMPGNLNTGHLDTALWESGPVLPQGTTSTHYLTKVKQKAFSTTLMLLHNCFVLPKLKLVFLTFLPSPVHCPPMHQPTFNCLFRMTCSMSPMLSVTWPQARPSAAQSSSAGLCLLLEIRREEAHPGRSTWGETG